jgi:hypothetical protein
MIHDLPRDSLLPLPARSPSRISDFSPPSCRPTHAPPVYRPRVYIPVYGVYLSVSLRATSSEPRRVGAHGGTGRREEAQAAGLPPG